LSARAEHGQETGESRFDTDAAPTALAQYPDLSAAAHIGPVDRCLGAVGLVVWLSAAAAGPQTYRIVQSAIGSWAGRVVLFGCTFAFFLHLCGGIRHLVWDTVHGFELRSIYISGWAVVGASVALTVGAWVASLFIAGWR
jgi:succinate dehydrogenase / fumarate reductase, cytochrome b subunit